MVSIFVSTVQLGGRAKQEGFAEVNVAVGAGLAFVSFALGVGVAPTAKISRPSRTVRIQGCMTAR